MTATAAADPIAVIGWRFELDNTFALALIGLLAYGARSFPILVFARARRLPHAWMALLPGLDLLVLMACVGVPRRTIMWFAGITGVLGLALLILIVAADPGEATAGLDRSILFGPDVVAMFLWMAACSDARLSRGWGSLAAWPVVGGIGAWRIVLEVKARLSSAPRFA